MSDKKTIKVREAVAVYNALRGINASKIPGSDKADLFAIIRTTRALKATAEAQADFERDAAERIKPADFDDLMKKREYYSTLTPEQQRQVVDVLRDYDKAFGDCVRPEQEKTVEVEIEPLSEAAIAAIAAASDNMLLDTLILIYDICGGK